MKHAKRELELVPELREFHTEILNLVDKFMESGQTNHTAKYYAKWITDVVYKLMMFEPLTPLTGEDDEWNGRISSIGQQNTRLSSVFKYEDGRAYYTEAVVFHKEDYGFTTCNCVIEEDTVSSHQFIEFPFVPKTFVIDVIELKEPKINSKGQEYWYKFKDRNQLLEVYKYYNNETIQSKG